ncbi:thiamine-phosphate kinase [Varibaculum vaginae]|uniref:thiamine-phosphate kinase n=1 Tax=Varibaculum vaginae TaxID=2364797 RepID=UPI000F092DCF|nr:thiamine-phosphate kinase [Varibaculum vaginae]
MRIPHPTKSEQTTPPSPSQPLFKVVPTPITAEDRLIADFSRDLHTHPRVLVGTGDDCAVLSHPDSRSVISTDVLVEGVHFRRDWMSLEQIGQRAAAQNAADIAAMGASAHSAVAAVTIPKNMDKFEISSLATGLAKGLESYGYALVGGDLSSGSCLQLAVTVIGDLQGRPPLMRSGAEPGDLVYFAGNLGDSAAGLALLERFESPEAAINNPTLPEALRDLAKEVVSRYQVPQVPADLASQLAGAGAHALMDVSDGLTRDGTKIAVASGVVIDLRRELLEKYTKRLSGLANILGIRVWDWVLGGGEDHGLLCTAPAGFSVPGFSPIGQVIAANSSRNLTGCTTSNEDVSSADSSTCANKTIEAQLSIDGKPHSQQGWDHFAG